MAHARPILILTALFLLAGCSVQKRHYRNGYHIEWLSAGKKVNDRGLVKHAGFVVHCQAPSRVERIEASAAGPGKKVIPIALAGPIHHKSLPVLSPPAASQPTTACDIIILRNGEELQAKVIEISETEIKYKLCSNLDGPVFIKLSSEVFKIRYPNGSSTVIPEKKVAPLIVTSKPTAATGPVTDKSQLVAFILCFLVGILGIHRFYLGYWGLGIAFLLTLGFCGIGALVDMIMILTGDLKPKDGEYGEKL